MARGKLLNITGLSYLEISIVYNTVVDKRLKDRHSKLYRVCLNDLVLVSKFILNKTASFLYSILSS